MYSQHHLKLFIASFLMASAWAANAVTWVGPGNGDWFVATNWNPAAVPVDGDAVMVTNNGILLTNTTAALSSFVLTNATLTVSNWNTCLVASDIVIAKNGLVTLPSAFSNAPQMSNRVWFVCSNFNLQYTGEINVDGKGYMGGRNNGPASGPGAGYGGVLTTSGSGGGGHGGKGGHGQDTDSRAGKECGVANLPTLPGSGGGSSGSYSPVRYGGSGGGHVRIEATGAVTIDGDICADATLGTSSAMGGGSGGGVYITCNEFSGIGSITVNGSRGNSGVCNGGGGGGGRIAVWTKNASDGMVKAAAGDYSDCIIFATLKGLTGAATATRGTSSFTGDNPPSTNSSYAGTIVLLEPRVILNVGGTTNETRGTGLDETSGTITE